MNMRHAPYQEPRGCLLPKRVDEINRVTNDIATALVKPTRMTAVVNLTMKMVGTDEAHTSWSVSNAVSLPRWISLPVHGAPIPPLINEVDITVVLNASGVPERHTGYDDVLNFIVESAAFSDVRATHVVALYT